MNAENILQLAISSAWMIFLAVAAFFGIITLILNHHWNKYGVRLEGLKRVRRIYIGVSGTLLATMLILLAVIVTK